MAKAGRLGVSGFLFTFIAIVSNSAGALPLISGDIVVTSTPNYCCSPSTTPDAYVLSQTGTFKNFFFQPFTARDTAIDASGRILFALDSSSTIVATDTNGAFLGFVPTPVSAGINGLAVASNGDLLVASAQSLYRLSSVGQFLGLTFLPEAVNGSMGVDPQDRLYFPIQSQCCSTTTTLNRLDLNTNTLSTITIPLGTVSGLDVSEVGQLIVSGSTSYFSSSNTLFRFDLDGHLIGSIAGPGGTVSVAVANLPEPGTAALLGAGLVALGLGRRRKA